MASTALEGAHEDIVDIEMHLLGLCGAREPTGRRCFRQAGHEGRCAFLTVSERGPRVRPGAGVDVTRARPRHEG